MVAKKIKKFQERHDSKKRFEKICEQELYCAKHA